MKKRFRDIIAETKYEDLLKIRQDIESGSIHIKRLIEDTIKEVEFDKIKTCATCGTTINRLFIEDYVLEFGRHDFKKRAYFCGQDCLRFFLNKIEPKKTKIKATNP